MVHIRDSRLIKGIVHFIVATVEWRIHWPVNCRCSNSSSTSTICYILPVTLLYRLQNLCTFPIFGSINAASGFRWRWRLRRSDHIDLILEAVEVWEYHHKSIVVLLFVVVALDLDFVEGWEKEETVRQCADERREEGVNPLESGVCGRGERPRIEETGVHGGEERRVGGEEPGVRSWEGCPLSGDDCEELYVFDPINLSKNIE